MAPYIEISSAYFARSEKDPVFLEMARRVTRMAAQTPPPDKASLEGVAFALNLSLDLYDLTREQTHLDDARRYADLAIRQFWVPNPMGGLFVHEARDCYYEAKLGAGDLLAGLLRLHLRTHPNVSVPKTYDWSF